jgi:hypothetical protein
LERERQPHVAQTNNRDFQLRNADCGTEVRSRRSEVR